MTNTNDLSDFGQREKEIAGELLKQSGDIDAGTGLKVEFNPMSGNVFLVDDDYRVFMLNDDDIISEWFNCSYCGHEGFKEDLYHDAKHKDCIDFMKEHDAISEEQATALKYPSRRPFYRINKRPQ